MRRYGALYFVKNLKMQQGHHKKTELAADRPSYREARWEKAVKVYTVNQESKYLLVQNVHALGVTQDLLREFALYGAIEEYRLLDEYPSEPFTDVYWIKFAAIDAARLAKKKLDNHSFFGKDLHVCYAPEYENVQDTREKLQQRRQIIAWKTRNTRTQGGSSHGNASAESTAPGPSSSVTTPTGLLPTPTLVPAPHVEAACAGPLLPSHDSHMSQCPVLPPPPLHVPICPPTIEPCQHITTGRTSYIETGSGMRPHRTPSGPGMGLHGSSGNLGMRSSSGSGTKMCGSGTGAGSGMGPGGLGMRPRGRSAGSGTRMDGSDPDRSGMGAGGMEGRMFDPAGLSTEDRVAAYLATEGVGPVGVAPAVAREKRGAAGGSGEVTSKKAKKRKRI